MLLIEGGVHAAGGTAEGKPRCRKSRGSYGSRLALGGLIVSTLLTVAVLLIPVGAPASQATHAQRIWSGQWAANKGSVGFRWVSDASGKAALVAQGGEACAEPSDYFVGEWFAETDLKISGCTRGASHLVGRYLSNNKVLHGQIDIMFERPVRFSGTYQDDGGESAAFTGVFKKHLPGDGCCPVPATLVGRWHRSVIAADYKKARVKIPQECNRPRASTWCPGRRATLRVGADGLWHVGRDVTGSIEAVGKRLRFAGGGYSEDGCFDAGAYSYGLSRGRLTLKLIQDPCPPRRVTLTGVWRRSR